MSRYHHLIASYGKKKKVKKISYKGTTLDTSFDTEELEEGKKIKTSSFSCWLFVCLLGRNTAFSSNILFEIKIFYFEMLNIFKNCP